MNAKYRVRQVLNSLFPPVKADSTWVFVYGVPRSGTTYFYRQWMQQAKVGVSDYDLKYFLPGIDHISASSYIPIDIPKLLAHFKEQLAQTGAPGGGSTFDFIVKQVHTTPSEFELISNIIGSQPTKKFFLFREPHGWMASAVKKFRLSEEDALAMYSESLASFNDIGGHAIEYGPDIPLALEKEGILCAEHFAHKSATPLTEYSNIQEQLQTQYESFKERLVSQGAL